MEHTSHKIVIPWMDHHQEVLDFQRVTVDGERATDVIEERNDLRARVAELEAAIRILDATETAHRHAGLGDPSKAYADLIALVQNCPEGGPMPWCHICGRDNSKTPIGPACECYDELKRLRARVEETEAWISQDGLSVLIEERDRYREALERIRDRDVLFDESMSEIAAEALKR